jgi:long-chain acyl-CoA synthetase
MTVDGLLIRNANKFAQKKAVVFEDVTLTYGQLNDRVNRLANSMLDLGLQKGDRVGVLIHNCHQFIEVYFACAKTGAIFCPYNSHLRQWELKDVIDYSKPKIMVFDRDYGAEMAALKPDLRSVETYISLQAPDQPFAKDYEALISQGKASEPGVKISEDDVISIIFTAGTTGRAKGAMRTHRHLIVNAYSSVIDLKVDYDESVLIVFPMYHVACEDNIVRHTFMPNTIYVKKDGGFNPPDILEYVSKERISRCHFVPTMIHSLIQVPDVSKYDLSSLRLILYAGSSMPVELLKRAIEVFPCGFAQLYGQTESGPFTTCLRPEDHVLDGSEKMIARLASSGKPAIDYEIRIVDDDDNDVPVGEVGEIIARSEAMMIGYWEMPEETGKKLKNGWLHTGDLGKVDEDGYVYIVERKNDLIISGGVNIYPREVEEVLYRHPAVSEVSVIGLPDEHWGEIVHAVIVPKAGVQVTAADIIAFCGENLAAFKKPKGVDFWKELPKSPQGKILKKEIRKEYAK